MATRLQREQIAFVWAQGKGKSALFTGAPCVKLVSLHSSKGLEFGLVIIPELCQMPPNNQDVAAEARLLYVGMTRALHELLLTCHGRSLFTDQLEDAMATSRTLLQAA